MIFAIYPNLEFGARAYAETRALAESAGRDPDSFRDRTRLLHHGGRNADHRGRQRPRFVDKLSRPVDTLALLSEALNFDFATKAPDDPFTDEELRSISGLQAIRDRVIRLSGNPNPTRDDFVRYSNRGTVREMPHFVGTASTVADRLQEWFERPACDGFVLAATHIPGTYEDFVRLVVPELQRRGIYHRDYAGTTLRENLGLAG